MASALTKAFDIVRLLRRTPGPLTLTSIAESVGVSPSTAHSVLSELLSHGMVTQDGDKRYQLGPAIYYWGSSFARNHPVFRVASRELVDLCNELKVVGVLAVPWDRHHLIVAAHQGGHSEVGVATGGRVPLDAGSWGKAYFAWSNEEIPAELTSYTARTITDRAAYQTVVDQVVECGYATDEAEFAVGVGGVASGVTGPTGYEGLISLLAPIGQMLELSLDAVGYRLGTIAARASFGLGDLRRLNLLGAE